MRAMTSPSIHLSRHVGATPEAVWGVLSDVRNAARTLSGVERVEVLSEGPYGVGTRWRETRTMMGKSVTEEMWVTGADAPRSSVIEAESAGTHYTTTFTITPEPGGSQLAMRFTAEMMSPSRLRRILWKVLGPIGIRASAKAMRTDLDDIAMAAEEAS